MAEAIQHRTSFPLIWEKPIMLNARELKVFYGVIRG